MWDMFITVLRMAALVYIGLVLLLAGCQRSMIYYPTRAPEMRVLAMGAAEGLIPWRNADGEIIGWHPRQLADTPDSMLLFHGNAGLAAHRGYFADGFAPDINVFIMEYPGYGNRAGKPSEQRFYAAAEDAFRQLQRERGGRIFVGGESLGSGVAAYLAGTFPDEVAGVFMSTPFSSLVDVARSHYPVFPVSWFMRDRYPSTRHLTSFSGPLAILLAENDEVVPARLGRQLYEAYAGPKRIWVQTNANHNTLNYQPGHPWWREAVAFLQLSE